MTTRALLLLLSLLPLGPGCARVTVAPAGGAGFPSSFYGSLALSQAVAAAAGGEIGTGGSEAGSSVSSGMGDTGTASSYYRVSSDLGGRDPELYAGELELELVRQLLAYGAHVHFSGCERLSEVEQPYRGELRIRYREDGLEGTIRGEVQERASLDERHPHRVELTVEESR